ncbi:hypothetical protein NOS3756_41420 [Nostoc sp. NIES-3756]|nr:hypothetical protein NOS3756_41420 [Nostoc sp. NIES-3756]BAY37057.1 hypothetical protein NIES2111_13910 [Nostoc sp. NIES-2111]
MGDEGEEEAGEQERITNDYGILNASCFKSAKPPNALAPVDYGLMTVDYGLMTND